MPHIHHSRLDGETHQRQHFPEPHRPIADDMSHLRTRTSTGSPSRAPHKDRKQRKAYFRGAAERKEVLFGPNVCLDSADQGWSLTLIII